jgi:hypothetical protein
LFEHQSSVDDLMAYRKLKYVSHTVDRHIEQARDNKVSPIPFPLVIPVLLHHSESGWTARTSVQELYHPAFTSNPIFAPYIPHLSFVLDDISHISNEALRLRAWRLRPTIAILLLRDGRSPERLADDMTYWAPAFEEVSPDHRVMRIFLSYIEQVAPDHLQQIFDAIAAHAPSTKDTLMTFSEVIAERVRKEALAQGQLEGQLEGQHKGHVAMLLRQLNRKFGDLPPAVRDRVTGATEVELDRWTDNILSAATIDDVFAQ